MEKITYRKTLDVHKNGIQFMLQGFETADNMSRVIEISLMASGDAVDFPLEQIEAMMYVTTPSSTEPSINACTIKDNKVVYEVLPIVEEGITTMQVKLIETSPEGATSVLCSPKFAVEVTKSNIDDETVKQKMTFTALEVAVSRAKATYDTRLLKLEVDDNCIFRAIYADGSVYETDAIKESINTGTTQMSKSYAMGGTGIREGEDTDNSKYYSLVSKSSSIEAKEDADDATELLTEVRKHGVYTSFAMDFESGELLYTSPSYNFSMDKESGELKVDGKDYSFEEVLRGMVAEDIAGDVAEILQSYMSASVAPASLEGTEDTPYTFDLSAGFDSPTLVRWDSLTAHTPYSYGLTEFTEGFAIVHGNYTENHTIVAWATGEPSNYFCHSVDGGNVKGWNRFLSTSGGTISGPLGIGGGKGAVDADDEGSVLEAKKDADNVRKISVANPTAENVPLEDAVKLSDIVGGIKTDYKLFGEHNLGILSGFVGNVQIETGTFKGIGRSALLNGQIPSIEFKTITPELVIITGGQGVFFFIRPSTVGVGVKMAKDYCYSAEWEGKKLRWTRAWYYVPGGTTSLAMPSSENGANSYPDYLADNNETYSYIGFGKSGGENA
jgi:hypothetical protein